ncbi:MAG: DUF2380 domain-containing protein [Calditrichaeota bacterium]|nr:MAG: DUF2380 domain-containing protein [Calditrichota bacterium]
MNGCPDWDYRLISDDYKSYSYFPGGIMFRKITPWVLFLFTHLTLAPHFGFAQQRQATRIAVLDLRGEGVTNSEAKTLTERLRSRLVNTGAFIVLEREQMNEILTEQGFQQSGCVSDECLVEIGRMVGVQQMVGGSIGKIGQTYTLDLRIIDVETGRILRTVSEDYRGSADGLLGVLEVAAQKIAGKTPAQRPKRVVTHEKSGSSAWWWIGGGVLLAAGAAAALLLGGKSTPPASDTGSDLPDASGIWPPPSN